LNAIVYSKFGVTHLMRNLQTTVPEITHRPSIGALERVAALTTATAVVAYGLSRRNVPGVFLAAAATPLAYRGLAGEWPRVGNGHSRHSARDVTRTALGGSKGIHVRESVRLEKPIDEVYRFWRHLENLPQFMNYLEAVTDLGNGRSRWVARGPAGTHVKWEAQIINEVENQLIGWESLPGGDVTTAGSVNFDTVRSGRSTQVSVHFQYAPPAGRAGSLIATVFGREPSQTVREDLRRLKQLLEAGEFPHATHESRESR
jgi:uncharacterized membrane protein